MIHIVFILCACLVASLSWAGPLGSKGNLKKKSSVQVTILKGVDPRRDAQPTIQLGVEILKAVVGSGVIDKRPAGVGDKFSNDIGSLYFFTQIKSQGWSAEKEQYIYHRWYYNGNQIASVRLKIGGPMWRTYSMKSIPKEAKGEWKVEAIDEGGNILKSEVFTVI